MATTSFTTEFQYAPSTKVFKFIDTFDYTGQSPSIAEANVNGVFTIVAPGGGVIYSNTDFSDLGCDIKVSGSRVNQLPISLPVNASDLVEKGIYTITYSVYNSVTLDTYIQVNTYDNTYDAVDIDILVVVNIIGKVFSQTDETNYVVNGITPIVTIVNTLKYPTAIKGGPPVDVVTTGQTLTTDEFYNGTQTSTITATVTYTFADGLIVSDSLYGSEETLIDGAFYCSIICGVKAFEASLCECSQAQYEIKSKQFTLAMSYVSLVMAEINCGGGDGIDDYLTRINDIIGDCDCGCDGDDDDAYSRITGWGTILGTIGPAGPAGSAGAAGATGATGAAGTNGTNGTNASAILLHSDAVPSTPAHVGAYSTLKSYTLAVGELAADGDALEILSSYSFTGTAGTKAVKFSVGNAGTTVALPSFLFGVISFPSAGVTSGTVRITITRLSATTAAIVCSFVSSSNGWVASNAGGSVFETSIVFSDFDSVTNLLNFEGFTTSPDTIVCNQLEIKYLNS
jgi:hypothetical protein